MSVLFCHLKSALVLYGLLFKGLTLGSVFKYTRFKKKNQTARERTIRVQYFEQWLEVGRQEILQRKKCNRSGTTSVEQPWRTKWVVLFLCIAQDTF